MPLLEHLSNLRPLLTELLTPFERRGGGTAVPLVGLLDAQTGRTSSTTPRRRQASMSGSDAATTTRDPSTTTAMARASRRGGSAGVS